MEPQRAQSGNGVKRQEERGKLKLRFLRFGRPQKVDPPMAENNKGGLGFTIYE